MKKLLMKGAPVALLALALVAGLLGAVQHNPQPVSPRLVATNPVTCQTKWTRPDDVKLQSGPFAQPKSSTVFVSTVVKYKRCLNKLGPDYIDLILARTTVFQDRKPYCNIRYFKGYRNTQASLMFVQPPSKLIKGGTITVPCKKGRFEAPYRDRSLKRMGNLYPQRTKSGRIISPKLRMSYKMDYNGGRDGHNTSLITVKF